MNPQEVLSSLSESERELLNKILSIEKRKLHIPVIKPNSRDEREIVEEIVSIVNKSIKE